MPVNMMIGYTEGDAAPIFLADTNEIALKLCVRECPMEMPIMVDDTHIVCVSMNG